MVGKPAVALPNASMAPVFNDLVPNLAPTEPPVPSNSLPDPLELDSDINPKPVNDLSNVCEQQLKGQQTLTAVVPAQAVLSPVHPLVTAEPTAQLAEVSRDRQNHPTVQAHPMSDAVNMIHVPQTVTNVPTVEILPSTAVKSNDSRTKLNASESSRKKPKKYNSKRRAKIKAAKLAVTVRDAVLG